MTARWDYRLDVSDVFRNDDMPWPERRDEMVRRIRALRISDRFELDDICDDLSSAETPDEWDEPWSAFYDFADYMRIWVNTWPKAATL